VVPPKKKVTLYFSSATLEETQHEAIRQDRSISWIIQAAWKIAREEVRRLPGVGGAAALPAPMTAAQPPSPAASAPRPPHVTVAANAKARGG
jgi:uncharacterized small protein (TIGR04563 family)